MDKRSGEFTSATTQESRVSPSSPTRNQPGEDLSQQLLVAAASLQGCAMTDADAAEHKQQARSKIHFR